MLQTIFNLRGNSYKSNKIPSTFEELQLAAKKILHLVAKESENTNCLFRFTFTTPSQKEEKPVSDDESLLQALSVAFVAENDDDLQI